MSNELPPLPKPRVPAVIATAENTESVRKGYEMGGYEKSPPLFDEKQVLAYGRACERAAYERAVKKCEEFEDELQTHGRDREADVAWRLARRIETLGADK